MEVAYDVKVGEIAFQYSSDETAPDNLSKAIRDVKTFLANKVIVKEFSLKHIENITK